MLKFYIHLVVQKIGFEAVFGWPDFNIFLILCFDQTLINSGCCQNLISNRYRATKLIFPQSANLPSGGRSSSSSPLLLYNF